MQWIPAFAGMTAVWREGFFIAGEYLLVFVVD